MDGSRGGVKEEKGKRMGNKGRGKVEKRNWNELERTVRGK